MVGVMDITLEQPAFAVNMHQIIIWQVHTQDGFLMVAGAELPQPGCTLMVAVHVVHHLQAIVNLLYDG
jgi:hypothetical protein